MTPQGDRYTPRVHETLLATIRKRCPEAETAIAAHAKDILRLLLPRFQGRTVTEAGVGVEHQLASADRKSAPSQTRCRIMVLALLVASAWGGCVPVPGPASCTVVHRPDPPAEALAPADRVLLLSAESAPADDPTMVCVRDAVRWSRPALKLVPAWQGPGTSLPGLEVPAAGTLDDFRRVLATPVAREAPALQNVRFLVVVSAMRRTSGPDQGIGLGATWATQESTLSADIWDVRQDVVVGTLEVTGSGTLRAVGVATGLRFMSVLSIPGTDRAACWQLGQQVAELLTGG